MVNIEQLHKETREELVRIDGKITTTIGAFGVPVAVLLAALAAGDADVTALESGWRFAGAAGLAAAVCSAWCLFAALWPRIEHPEPGSKIRYWGHVATFRLHADFAEALAEQEHVTEDERLIEQTHTLAGIVQKKYLLYRRSLWLYALAFGLTALALSVG